MEAMSVKQENLKVGDYVVYHYEQEECYGTVLELKKEKARVRLCISMKKSEEPLFEQVVVAVDKLTKRFG